MSAPGLYVHVPFCARACPYCDFDFEVSRLPDLDMFFGALDREVAGRSDVGMDHVFEAVDTVYVGGGTPSVLGPEGIERLGAWLGRVRGPCVERTIELNPEHVDPPMVAAVVAAGFDRVSLGIQTFDADGLRELGRAHHAEQARAAIEALKRAGLRVSIDLIVGWRGQDLARLERDLVTVAESDISHLSIYALTIEPGVPWHKLVRRGLRVLPDDDAGAEAMVFAHRWLLDAGWEHYEIASYGQGGERARHNGKYWAWADYVGLGPSAASATFGPGGGVVRRSNRRGLRAWVSDPATAGDTETLTADQAAREGLWTGLRRLDGMDVEAFTARFGRSVSWLDAILAPMLHRGDLRWLVREGGARVLAVAPDRWLWHDQIGSEILSGPP